MSVTGSPLATTSSGPTVQDLLDQILPRLQEGASGPTIFEAANSAITIINNHLWAKESDIIRKSFSVDYAAEATSVAMPADFLGLSEKPTISGHSEALKPLPLNTRHAFTDLGDPEYYELEDTKVYLFPVPTDAGTLTGKYYRKYPLITALSDTIPFNGLFDQIIVDTIIIVMNAGLSIVGDKAFILARQAMIDNLIINRSAQIPYRRPVQFF